MKEDIIIVGAGIAGLTAAAYLLKAGHRPLLLEKESHWGGLVNSFERDGFVYDGGIRAIENSGIVFPMLKKLDLEVLFVKNEITVGIEDRVIRIESDDSVREYQELLTSLYPENDAEIQKIMHRVREIMHYMDVQYGIDNPLFLDIKEDRDYFLKVILPWMFKYAFTVGKISAMNEPVVAFLKHYTHNQSLLDIITQHFFHETPAYFALSYLNLYMDYYYPLGGTGVLPDKLAHLIQDQGGKIQLNTTIQSIDLDNRSLVDQDGNLYGYRQLIWAADQKSLYRMINQGKISNPGLKTAIQARWKSIREKTGNDSIFTLYLGLDIEKSYFEKKASEHFFYTPSRKGQTQAGPIPIEGDRAAIEAWLSEFLFLTTYEITCPVMRDSTLAPQGKTGLIVSLLFDYQLTKHIRETGWYDDFKSFCENRIIEVLETTIYPGIREKILHCFSSTPLTIEKFAGTTDGAITGWAFSNHPIPAESRLSRIANSVRTPIPGVFQAGQWTYSPSGLPIAVLTGKMAADQVTKALKKKRV